MSIFSKNILIAIHGNIESDMKKYVLTNSGTVLINEISTYVKKNLDNYVIYSSTELIALLTAKAIFQKTKVLTKIERGLDNNKQLFNDNQVNVNSLNDDLFIDTNHKYSTFFKEHETLVETFLRVKKILKNILLNEPNKNIVFIVSSYIGECLINCLNEYKKYDLKDDVYIYSIEYKIESLRESKKRVRIINSCLVKSTNLLRKTFFKLKREKKIVRKFSLFGCCYFQYTYSDSDEDDDEGYISNSTSNGSNTRTEELSKNFSGSTQESTKEYIQTHLYQQDVNIDTFLSLDKKYSGIFNKNMNERKKKTENNTKKKGMSDLQYLKVDSFKSFRMQSTSSINNFPSDQEFVVTEEEEEKEEEEESQFENSTTLNEEKREQLKTEIFKKIEKNVLKQEVIDTEHIDHKEEDINTNLFLLPEEDKESKESQNLVQKTENEISGNNEYHVLMNSEKLFLKIKELQLGEPNEEYLNIEEIVFFLNIKGFTLTEAELLELNERKIDKEHCAEQLKELMEYYKDVKENYKKQFLSCFINNDQNISYLHKDTLQFILTNYGDKLDENECGEFFEKIDLPEYVNAEVLFEKLSMVDCSSVSQVLLGEE